MKWHTKAVIMGHSFLPKDCPLVQHVIKMFKLWCPKAKPAEQTQQLEEEETKQVEPIPVKEEHVLKEKYTVAKN